MILKWNESNKLWKKSWVNLSPGLCPHAHWTTFRLTNTVFYKYYTLKRNQGKSHRCALGHVVRKLLRVIYHLISNDILFDETRLI